MTLDQTDLDKQLKRIETLTSTQMKTFNYENHGNNKLKGKVASRTLKRQYFIKKYSDTILGRTNNSSLIK